MLFQIVFFFLYYYYLNTILRYKVVVGTHTACFYTFFFFLFCANFYNRRLYKERDIKTYDLFSYS